jgi:hypothetical protein
VIVYALATAKPKVAYASGAILGKHHVSPLGQRLASASAGEIVVLDFAGIETATSSYLKSTALWLFNCGRLSATSTPTARREDKPGAEPFDVFPVILRPTPEVEDGLDEVFGRRFLPCLIADGLKSDGLVAVRMVGELEETLKRTLSFLQDAGATTAADLHQRNPDERINPTAWNNRLAELFRLRLAKRTKQGRFLIYEAITNHIDYGRRLRT